MDILLSPSECSGFPGPPLARGVLVYSLGKPMVVFRVSHLVLGEGVFPSV